MSGYHATFLFASPSFVEGAARTLDLAGTLNEYNTSLTEDQADAIALYADWRAVRADLEASIRALEAQLAGGAQEPPGTRQLAAAR